jgi:pyrroloquinoline-quinone synthase
VAVTRLRGRDEVAEALRGLGDRYWDRLPFHTRPHTGECEADEVRSWVANRWHYRRSLSQKNAALAFTCDVLSDTTTRVDRAPAVPRRLPR